MTPTRTLPALIPRSLLFGSPDRLAPTLSPDGEMLAFLAPHLGALNVWVGPWRTGRYRPVTHDSGRGITQYLWCGDSRRLLFMRDKDGDENNHLLCLTLHDDKDEEREPVDLTPFPGVQARLVGQDDRDAGRVLVGLNLRRPDLHDVFRLDLDSGELTQVAENPVTPRIRRWLADGELRVRGAVASGEEGASLLLGLSGEGEWRVLLAAGPEDAALTRPVGFTADGSALIAISSVGAATAKLLRIEAATGERSVLAADPVHDVVGVGVHPVTREPQYAVVQAERSRIEVLDQALTEDFAALAALRGGDVSLLGRATDDSTWLVQDNIDDGPAAYYVYSRRGRTAQALFTHLPALSAHRLAHREPFSFQARDGLTIHGYLTCPPGVERRDLPAVLNVHGGPWLRDVWGFRGEPQWLANRGYLCVEVNFRGSTGYGKDFVNAADREWGGAMQNDLTDAVAHLVAAGLCDRDRVAIMGASYGGYAALAGAAFTPDLYRCAIAVAAPADLRSFIEAVPGYWRPMASMLHLRIGDPRTEPGFLWSRSPLSKVDEIAIPLLIAHGANDPRVDRSEPERLVAALAERGVPHRYLLFADEGHGIVRPANRETFYAAAEEFLAEHLGGRLEPDGGVHDEHAAAVG